MLDNSRSLHPAARTHQKDYVAVVRDESVAEDSRGVVEEVSRPDGTARQASVMETEDETVNKHIGTKAGN